jgi:nitrate/nitrite transporter NarK
MLSIGLIVQPLSGALSDRVGRRRILLVGLVLYVLAVFPFFWALESRSPVWIFLGFVLLLKVAHSLGNAVSPSSPVSLVAVCFARETHRESDLVEWTCWSPPAMAFVWRRTSSDR